MPAVGRHLFSFNFFGYKIKCFNYVHCFSLVFFYLIVFSCLLDSVRSVMLLLSSADLK